MNYILSYIYKYTIYYLIYSNDLGNSKFYPQGSSSLPILFSVSYMSIFVILIMRVITVAARP